MSPAEEVGTNTTYCKRNGSKKGDDYVCAWPETLTVVMLEIPALLDVTWRHSACNNSESPLSWLFKTNNIDFAFEWRLHCGGRGPKIFVSSYKQAPCTTPQPSASTFSLFTLHNPSSSFNQETNPIYWSRGTVKFKLQIIISPLKMCGNCRYHLTTLTNTTFWPRIVFMTFRNRLLKVRQFLYRPREFQDVEAHRFRDISQSNPWPSDL